MITKSKCPNKRHQGFASYVLEMRITHLWVIPNTIAAPTLGNVADPQIAIIATLSIGQSNLDQKLKSTHFFQKISRKMSR